MASILAAATGLVHSALGERLIFRHLREGSMVPSRPAQPLQGRHVRILWATWHLASVLAWAFAGLLWQVAHSPSFTVSAKVVLGATAGGFLGSSLLVLIGTRGRHPGWVALGAVGILAWVAIGAA
ncbi:MAG TPA: hypothetical protein VJ505_14400 [Holophagaceae bacterium]|nr:hypothetical protein [Holophagaceae bacterium]